VSAAGRFCDLATVFQGFTSYLCLHTLTMVLSSRMPDLDSFEVFAAIAQTGSLGGAARELGLTQQAVSRRLASMEAKTGLTLAVRTTRGSQLTSAGALAAQLASHLIEVACDVDAKLASLRQRGRERIAVVASPTVAENLMPHWLLSMRTNNSQHSDIFPRVDLTATIGVHAIAAVREGTADVGFVENPDPPEGLGCCVVGRDELVVVVPLGHKWSRRSRDLSPDELAQTPLISSESHSGIRAALTAALRRALGADMQEASPLIELPSAGAMRSAVLAGAGPAVMSQLAVADDLALGRLRAVAVSQLDLRRELRAVWVGGRTPPAGGVERLLSHIRSTTAA